MQITRSKEGVFTIDCNEGCGAIFRHYVGWGYKVICPYCGAEKSLRTLMQEAEARKEGISALP